MDDLRRICETIREVAAEAGVHVVTGDTKVVNRGHGDGIYINTAGVGLVPAGVELSGANCKPGDAILLSGTLGDHGILHHEPTREPLVQRPYRKRRRPLNDLIADVLAAAPIRAASATPLAAAWPRRSTNWVRKAALTWWSRKTTFRERRGTWRV